MNDKFTDTDIVDSAIEAIKKESPSNADVNAAAERVRAALFANDENPMAANVAQPLATDRELNSTEHYIAAIPDYLQGRLSDAQKLLFEEETRQSIPLRRALNTAKQQQAAQVQRPRRRRGNALRWIASAAAVAIVAVAGTFVLPQMPSFDQSQLAQVDEVQGKLYRVVDGRMRELTPGTWIDGREYVRTANNSSAMVTLDDGSRIEIDQRSEFRFTRRGRGNRIDVDRGKIIVAASPQGSGTLDVATDDFVVSVTGTIFEVGHGTNGSRVSVIEGKVKVHQEGDSTNLTPGERFASRMGKTVLGIDEADLTWSRNADEYISMLRDINALQNELDVIMTTEPRYSVRLLNLVPKNTVVYGAVPNAPEKIAEVYTVIRDRIQQSPSLSRAVASVEVDTELQQLEDVMTWLAEVGDTLGDETVTALVLQQSATNNNVHPLILSEVDAEAFRETLASQLVEFRQMMSEIDPPDPSQEVTDAQVELGVAIIDDPSEAQPNQLSIWLHEDLLIASTSQDVLFEVQSAIVTGGSHFMNGGLYTELVNFYNRGAEFLGALDIARLLALEPSQSNLQTVGIDNAQYLIVHHQRQTGRVNFTADLLFDGQRHGIMSWLSPPSPMGSLDFFSGNTTFVTAGILKDPSLIFADVKTMTEQATGQAWENIDTSNQFARDIRNNLIATLGGEAAMGLDGPALPTPSWKIVIEVYDEVLLQSTIEQVINFANQQAAVQNPITLTPAPVGIYDGYQLQFTAQLEVGDQNPPISSDISINYAYVDGYMLLAPNLPFLERAINQYHSGIGLLAEHDFQVLLPENYLDVSALTYSRVARLVDDLTKNIPTGIVLNDEQRSELRDMYMENRSGSMLSIIGEPEVIRFVHSGNSLLPLNLSSIFSLQSVAGMLIGEQQLINIPGALEASEDDQSIEVEL